MRFDDSDKAVHLPARRRMSRMGEMWLALLAALVCSSCRQSETAAPPTDAGATNQAAAAAPAADPLEMTELKEAFAGAIPAMRFSIDETVSSIQGHDFRLALQQLQRLSQNQQLTPQQRQAVNEAIAKVRRLASGG